MSAAGLFAAALAAPQESDERWDAIRALQELGGQEVFDQACALCRESDPDAREVGIDVLAQLPGHEAPAGAFLLAMLETEEHPLALQSIGVAFGHLRDPRGIAPLAALRRHEDENVRFGVVLGLTGQDDDLAVDALVELSADPDDEVRNWATFALGSQIERDTPQVRDALAARLADAESEVHDEAVAGLAARRDERALEPLLADIEEGWEGPLIDEALYALAAATADPRLEEHVAERWDATPAELRDDVMTAAAQRYGLT